MPFSECLFRRYFGRANIWEVEGLDKKILDEINSTTTCVYCSRPWYILMGNLEDNDGTRNRRHSFFGYDTLS